jgi:hypothetical protein
MKSWMRAARAAASTSVAAGVVAAIGDVVEDRVVEQHRVLRHHADGGMQAVLRDVAQVLPVDAQRPPVTS